MKIPPKPPTTGLSYNENQRPPIKCEVISGFYDDQSAGPLKGERLPPPHAVEGTSPEKTTT